MLFQKTADLLGIPLREPHSCEDALHPSRPPGRGDVLAAHCVCRVHRFRCYSPGGPAVVPVAPTSHDPRRRTPGYRTAGTALRIAPHTVLRSIGHSSDKQHGSGPRGPDPPRGDLEPSARVATCNASENLAAARSSCPCSMRISAVFESPRITRCGLFAARPIRTASP